MPDTSAIKELNASRTEALQGLLRSLGHTTDPSSGATEQLQTLTKRIEEIVGHSEDRGKTPKDQPDQLLNEDGLPVVDISESVNEDFQSNTSSLPVLEQDLVPLSQLPPDEKERRRRERNRILDLLEEEERLQQLQEERDAEEERKEAIRKQKEAAKVELDRLKAARELQRKMGQALVQHTKRTVVDGQDGDAYSKHQTTSSVAKKSVSFADVPAVEANERTRQTSIHQPEWGDVAPARLRAPSRVPLVSAAKAQKSPIKMRVVERHPAATPASSFRDCADSDDESGSSAGRLSPCVENDTSDGEDMSSLGHDNLSDDELLAEGLDYDTVQHHREIALEYHEKRHAIGAETAKAMSALALDDYDQEETSNAQLPLSRFRADRMAAAYDRSHGLVSASVEQRIIPASRQKSLRNSVRLGTLEDGQLVGGAPGESGSEDEAVREVIQMLQTETIQNVGPDFRPSSTTTTTTLPRGSDAVESPSVGPSTTARGAKPSRFKVARGGGAAGTTTLRGHNTRDNAQSQPAISRVVERKASSPRSLPSQQSSVSRPSPRPPSPTSGVIPSMIIDSPSFYTTPVTSSFPPSHPIVTGSPLPRKTQLECPSFVDLDSPATQDRPRAPTRDPLSADMRAPKFVADRKKTNI